MMSSLELLVVWVVVSVPVSLLVGMCMARQSKSTEARAADNRQPAHVTGFGTEMMRSD